jgi:2-C-methyl-D-erythritol 4-phosphate cytidylyltransferase
MTDNEAVLEPTAAVLVAAGSSTRMGTGPVRKPFIVIEGLTLIERACAAFDRSAAVREIVLVAHPEDLERLGRMRTTCTALRKVSRIVAGGELRTDSVRAGVQAVDNACRLVAIHDVARPLVETATIDEAIGVAGRHGAALVAIPMADTVKTSSDGVHAESTLDRSVLWCAQTPQVFRLAKFRQLLASARSDDLRPTDDAVLYERYVGPVPIVRGSAQNLKITTSEDLVLAASILRTRQAASPSSTPPSSTPPNPTAPNSKTPNSKTEGS